MIKKLLRVIRRMRKLCVDCGVVPEEGRLRCEPCSLILVDDFLFPSPPVEVSFEGPVYFNEDQEKEDKWTY